MAAHLLSSESDRSPDRWDRRPAARRGCRRRGCVPSSRMTIWSAVHHRGDALGDDDFGDLLQLGQRRADLGLGGGVHRAGGVVKDENLGLFEQGAGDAQPLLLPAGDVDAALARGRCPGPWASAAETRRRRPPGRPPTASRRLASGLPHWRFSRTVPENRTFFCSTMPTASRRACRSYCPHIPPADLDAALGDVVEPGDQLHQGASWPSRCRPESPPSAPL